MKKSELLARIQALEARVIALEARPVTYPPSFLGGTWPHIVTTGVCESGTAIAVGGFLPGSLEIGTASAQ